MKSFQDFVTPANLPAIYLDMDETIVGWHQGADDALAKFGYPKWSHQFWKQYADDEADEIRWAILNKVSNFWINLKFTSDGRRIWDFVKKYKPHILSACTGHSPSCKPEKHVWLAKNLGLNNLGNIYLVSRPEKKKFARAPSGAPNLLIDDYPKNCNEFRASGGLAIQVTTASEVIAELKALGFK